jgi:DNA-binding transcriptional LysR family regulator
MDWADRIGSRLKLRDLHILLAVVEWKGMAKAARHLAVSQPVVSRAIADLEQGLGVRLLDRTPQGIEPTVYGRTLLLRGLAVFDELRGGVKDIKFLSDPTAGELRIGSNQAIAAGLLVAILDQLSAQRPRLAFQVKLGDAAMLLYHDLRERNVDLLFGRMLDAKEDDVHTEILFEDPLYVIAGTSSPWTRRRKLALKDLIDEPWTMPSPDTNAGAMLEQAFRAEGLAIPHITVSGYGTQLQSALVSTGRFLAIVPGSYLKFNAKHFGHKALSIKLRVPPNLVGVARLKNRTISPLAALFIDCARAFSKPFAALSHKSRS